MKYHPIRGHILKQVYNIVSQQPAISPRRVLFIFVNLFIEGIWGWKLNSLKFNFNFHYKIFPKCEKRFYYYFELMLVYSISDLDFFFK